MAIWVCRWNGCYWLKGEDFPLARTRAVAAVPMGLVSDSRSYG